MMITKKVENDNVFVVVDYKNVVVDNYENDEGYISDDENVNIVVMMMMMMLSIR